MVRETQVGNFSDSCPGRGWSSLVGSPELETTQGLLPRVHLMVERKTIRSLPKAIPELAVYNTSQTDGQKQRHPRSKPEVEA